MIVDEISFLRMGVKTALGDEDGVDVIADCRPGGDALATAERLRPDVLLTCLRWPDQDATDFCRQIRERIPTTRVLIMSQQNWEEELLISILAGASGYVSQNAEGPELVKAIRVAANGGGYFDWPTVRRVVGRLRRTAGPAPP